LAESGQWWKAQVPSLWVWGVFKFFQVAQKEGKKEDILQFVSPSLCIFLRLSGSEKRKPQRSELEFNLISGRASCPEVSSQNRKRSKSQPMVFKIRSDFGYLLLPIRASFILIGWQRFCFQTFASLALLDNNVLLHSQFALSCPLRSAARVFG
jgi:hypothetical protein